MSDSEAVLASNVKTVPRRVHLDDLLVDPKNYRLHRPGADEEVPDERVEGMQREVMTRLALESLSKLQNSILKNGFLEVDRIVVRELRTKAPAGARQKYLVIEGNRRTAALKRIQGQYLAGDDIPDALIRKMADLNVVEVTGPPGAVKRFARRVMGIRHVSRVKVWWGFNSAALVADLYAELEDFSKIDDVLGLGGGDAKRLYEQYMAFTQFAIHRDYARQANPRKHYALLAEFLSRGGKAWLGWNESTFEFDKKDRKEEVYRRIVPAAGQTAAEIHNPARARFAVRVMMDADRSNQFGDGIPLDDIPPFPTKGLPVLSRLKRALGYLRNLPPADIRDGSPEMRVVQEIIDEASALLPAGDVEE